MILKMAGVAGFEPTHAEIKTRCLTAWRHPSRVTIAILRKAVIDSQLYKQLFLETLAIVLEHQAQLAESLTEQIHKHLILSSEHGQID